MRDAFGEIDPDEIDIIDPDPTAFGPVPADPDAPAAADDAPRRRRPAWLIPVAGVGVLVLAALGVLVWQPWSGDDTVSLPSPQADPPTLSGELVFGAPPAELTSSWLGNGAEEVNFFGDETIGYFFAEPGAAFDLESSDRGRWAAFTAAPVSPEDGDPMEGREGTKVTVQGVPGVLTPGPLAQLDFGPVDGMVYSVAGAGLTNEELVALGEAVGVDDGVPVVDNRGALLGMEPIGSFASYRTIAALMILGGGDGFQQNDMVTVHYGTAPGWSVSSAASLDETSLPMLEFVFGAASGHTVHGLPAVATDKSPLQLFDGGDATIVAWVEGGRLIVVTGPDDVEATVALAESVRAASDDEWVAVAEVADTDNSAGFPVVDQVGVEIAAGTDPDGTEFQLRLDGEGSSLSICVEETDGNSTSSNCGSLAGDTLPMLTTYAGGGRTFAVAIVEDGSPDAEIRVTAEGSIATYSLVPHGVLHGSQAAAVLDGTETLVELVVGGEVVATL
jgi:hypothetical protein